jgi:hypothetical protein
MTYLECECSYRRAEGEEEEAAEEEEEEEEIQRRSSACSFSPPAPPSLVFDDLHVVVRRIRKRVLERAALRPVPQLLISRLVGSRRYMPALLSAYQANR